MLATTHPSLAAAIYTEITDVETEVLHASHASDAILHIFL